MAPTKRQPVNSGFPTQLIDTNLYAPLNGFSLLFACEKDLGKVK